MNDTAAIFFLPPPGSRCVQAFVPLSVRKAPASIPNGHDRRRYRQTPFLPLRGVQIPRSGISFLERGLVFTLSLYLHQNALTKPYLFIQLLHIELRWTSK